MLRPSDFIKTLTYVPMENDCPCLFWYKEEGRNDYNHEEFNFGMYDSSK